MSVLSVAILAFHDSTDVLKETLQKSRAALQSCRFYVATSSEDKEIISLCQALGIQNIQFTRDVIMKDGALFNYAGIARACIAFIKNDQKRDQWILLTRPQVVLHDTLADIDLGSLAKDSLYGCGMKEIFTREEFKTYTPEIPSAMEVRELVPDSSFLLAFSDPPRFDSSSVDTDSAVKRYSDCFVARYMIHLKLAYLGPLNADMDVRKTLGKWGHVPSVRLRIEPVHAYITQQEEAAKEAALKEAAAAKLAELAAKEAELSAREANLAAKEASDKAMRELREAEILAKEAELNAIKEAEMALQAKEAEMHAKEAEMQAKEAELKLAEAEAKLAELEAAALKRKNKFFIVLGNDEESSSRATSLLDSQQNVAKPHVQDDTPIVKPKPAFPSVWNSRLSE
jgi:hypothetical protein